MYSGSDNDCVEKRDKCEKSINNGSVLRESMELSSNKDANDIADDEQDKDDEQYSDPPLDERLNLENDKEAIHPGSTADLEAFDTVDEKDVALRFMYKLSPQEVPYDNAKRKWIRLPESYKKWNKLNTRQRDVARGYWSKLAPSVRKKVLEQMHAESQTVANQKTAQRARNTTANDKIRLLHIRAEPSFQAIWQEVLNSFANQQRQLLDAQHSHASPERDAELNPWEKIAVAFNDHRGFFQPQNSAIMYIAGKEGEPVKAPRDPISGKAIPASPVVPPQMAQDLYDLEPNEPMRPLRDGQWCKEKFNELKADISKCWNAFDRSGQHSNNKYSKEGRLEWHTKFADKYDNAVKYSILALDELLENMGKRLPCGSSRETGLLGEEHGKLTSSALNAKGYSSNPATVYKRKYRQSLSSGSGEFHGQIAKSIYENTCEEEAEEAGGIHIARAIEKASMSVAKQEMKIQALIYLAGRQNGSPEKKRRAEDELEKIAFGSLEED